MLSGLRYFEASIKETNGSTKSSFSWGKVDMIAMARCLMIICKNLQELLSSENRMIRISAPCYVLGINIK